MILPVAKACDWCIEFTGLTPTRDSTGAFAL